MIGQPEIIEDPEKLKARILEEIEKYPDAGTGPLSIARMFQEKIGKSELYLDEINACCAQGLNEATSAALRALIAEKKARIWPTSILVAMTSECMIPTGMRMVGKGKPRGGRYAKTRWFPALFRPAWWTR